MLEAALRACTHQSQEASDITARKLGAGVTAGHVVGELQGLLADVVASVQSHDQRGRDAVPAGGIALPSLPTHHAALNTIGRAAETRGRAAGPGTPAWRWDRAYPGQRLAGQPLAGQPPAAPDDSAHAEQFARDFPVRAAANIPNLLAAVHALAALDTAFNVAVAPPPAAVPDEEPMHAEVLTDMRTDVRMDMSPLMQTLPDTAPAPEPAPPPTQEPLAAMAALLPVPTQLPEWRRGAAAARHLLAIMQLCRSFMNAEGARPATHSLLTSVAQMQGRLLPLIREVASPSALLQNLPPHLLPLRHLGRDAVLVIATPLETAVRELLRDLPLLPPGDTSHRPLIGRHDTALAMAVALRDSGVLQALIDHRGVRSLHPLLNVLAIQVPRLLSAQQNDVKLQRTAFQVRDVRGKTSRMQLQTALREPPLIGVLPEEAMRHSRQRHTAPEAFRTALLSEDVTDRLLARAQAFTANILAAEAARAANEQRQQAKKQRTATEAAACAQRFAASEAAHMAAQAATRQAAASAVAAHHQRDSGRAWPVAAAAMGQAVPASSSRQHGTTASAYRMHVVAPAGTTGGIVTERSRGDDALRQIARAPAPPTHEIGRQQQQRARKRVAE